MENYVYSFVEEDAADKFFDDLLKVSSDYFKQPKIQHIDRSTFHWFFKNVIIKPEYHDITSFSDGKSFIKLEYDDKTITVYKLKSSDKRKLIYSLDEDNGFLFRVENAVEQKNFEVYEKTGGWEPFTPSSKETTIPRELADAYEDTMKKLGVDTKNRTIDLLNENLNDPQKVKELHDDLERKVEGYHIDDQSIKSDAGKLRLTLVPREIIRAIARARMYGLRKYGDKESWRSVSIDRYNDALCRHILLYLEDPDGVDEESGLSHLDHVACNVAFLCELKKENKKKYEEPRICGICKHCICGIIDTCELDGTHISFWQANACTKFEPKEGHE